MSEIRIQYEALYQKTAELRNRLTAELQEMNEAYRQCNTALRRMDGKTNATLMDTMVVNQQKAQVTAETLTKLLTFIDSAAQQVERDEQLIARQFTMSRVGTARRGS